MKEILEHIQKEWQVVRAAPVLVTFSLITLTVAIWAGMSWLYGPRLTTQRERTRHLTQRLAEKQEQLEEYRQRVQYVKPPTSLERLTNTQLRDKALKLAADVLEHVENYERERRQQPYPHPPPPDEERFKSDAAYRDEWLKNLRSVRDAHRKAQDECEERYEFDYLKKFRTDAILMREELHRRLPVSVRQERPIVEWEQGADGIPVRNPETYRLSPLILSNYFVAGRLDDLFAISYELNRLARLLPTETQ